MAAVTSKERSAHVESAVQASLGYAEAKPNFQILYVKHIQAIVSAHRLSGEWTLTDARASLRKFKDVDWVVAGFAAAGVEKRKR